MPKDRDWMDYAGLGSQLGQNLQLSDLQQKLNAIGQVAVARELRDQYEAHARARLELLREMIFQADRNLKAWRESLPTEPRSCLAAALRMKRLLDENCINTALATAYEDKERLQALFDDLKLFTAESRGHLSQQEQETVEQCAAYQAEEGDFDELIQWLRSKEEVEATHRDVEAKSRRLDELKKASYRRRGFVLWCALPGILIGILSFVARDPGLMLWGIGIGSVGMVVCAILEATPAQRQLEKEINSLESELQRAAEMQIGAPSANAECLRQKLGKDLNTAEFTKILEDRKAFIKGVMGKEQAKNQE